MPGNATPMPLRIARLARLVLHLIRGLWTTWLHFPRMAAPRREQAVRQWSRELLRILSITVRAERVPAALPARCMLVTNHISWLDIFVIDSLHPANFVAKSEIRSWPLVGWLCTRVGTLYIERGKRASVRRAKERITQALSAGVLIAVCPEGMTTHGRRL
jgi:1-acyl-sn-glycerol-3-phosphate acyltransferase